QITASLPRRREGTFVVRFSAPCPNEPVRKSCGNRVHQRHRTSEREVGVTIGSSHPGKLEPPRGFEPRTDGLRNHCSTAELRRLASARLFYGSEPSDEPAATAAGSRAPALRRISSPFSASTRTVSPSRNLPSSTAIARGSWIRRC